MSPQDAAAALEEIRAKFAATLPRLLARVSEMAYPYTIEPGSPTEAIHKAIAVRMALGLDEAISLAISAKLGRADWDTHDLMGRLTAMSFPDGRTEWRLDDEPIIESFPLTVERDGRIVSATQWFRRFP